MTQEKGIPYQRHKPSAALREFLDPLDPGSYFDCGRARLHGLDDALLKEAESRGRRIGDDSFQLVATDMGLIFCRPSISFAIAARWEDLMLIRPKGDDPVVLSVTWPTHGELKFTLSRRLAGNVFRRWLQLRMQAARQARSQESRFAREDHHDSPDSEGWEVVTKVDRPTKPEPKDPGTPASVEAALVRDRRAERSAKREQLQRQGERRRRAEPIPASAEASASASRAGFEPSGDEPDERGSRRWRSTAAPTTQMARPLPTVVPLLEHQDVEAGDVLTADEAPSEAPAVEVRTSEPTDWPQIGPSEENVVVDLTEPPTDQDEDQDEDEDGEADTDSSVDEPIAVDEPRAVDESRVVEEEPTADAVLQAETELEVADDRSLEPAIRPVPVPRTTPTSWVGSPFSFVATVVVLSTFVLIAVAAVSSYRRAVEEGEGSGVAPASPSVTRTTIDHRRFQLDSATSATITSEVVDDTAGSTPVERTTTAPSLTDTSPEVAEEQPPQLCNSNYSGCVPTAEDVDCPGDGDGPAYSVEPAVVMGQDIYELDTDGDGETCEADQPLSSATEPGEP